MNKTTQKHRTFIHPLRLRSSVFNLFIEEKLKVIYKLWAFLIKFASRIETRMYIIL